MGQKRPNASPPDRRLFPQPAESERARRRIPRRVLFFPNLRWGLCIPPSPIDGLQSHRRPLQAVTRAPGQPPYKNWDCAHLMGTELAAWVSCRARCAPDTSCERPRCRPDCPVGIATYWSRYPCCRSTLTGIVNENVDPAPCFESTQIFPPCISIIRLEIVSPSPVPPFLRVIELSACWNS